ncbi:hypothetical protein FKM82_022718 [Ascaphus truei]
MPTGNVRHFEKNIPEKRRAAPARRAPSPYRARRLPSHTPRAASPPPHRRATRTPGATPPLPSDARSERAAMAGVGGGNDFQWCFSQVKGAIDEDVAEGECAGWPSLSVFCILLCFFFYVTF